MQEIAQAILHVLRDFPEIVVAVLFGSAASDRLSPNSDIDIGIAAQRPLPLERKLELFAALARALPREVDLVDLQEVSGLILQQALCTGVLLKSTPPVYAALMKRMWFNQADMMPNTKMILQKQAERFVNG